MGEVLIAFALSLQSCSCCSLLHANDYPGWDDERHCPTGLLGYIRADGGRPVYEPLAEEIAVQQRKACCVEPASCRLDQACNRKVAASVSAPRPDAYGGRLGSPAREARAER